MLFMHVKRLLGRNFQCSMVNSVEELIATVLYNTYRVDTKAENQVIAGAVYATHNHLNCCRDGRMGDAVWLKWAIKKGVTAKRLHPYLSDVDCQREVIARRSA